MAKKTDPAARYLTQRKSAAAYRQLRADAARYRWLREQDGHTGGLVVVLSPKPAIRMGCDLPSHERLDAAVDEARRVPPARLSRSGAIDAWYASCVPK